MLKFIEQILSVFLLYFKKRADGKERRTYEKTTKARNDIADGNVKRVNTRMQFLLWKAARAKRWRDNDVK